MITQNRPVFILLFIFGTLSSSFFSFILKNIFNYFIIKLIKIESLKK